jgi:hypothetical protein
MKEHYKHKYSGKIYTYLGKIKHKDETTREWVEHSLYKGDGDGGFYSRTVKDFMDNFEIVKQ